MNRKAIGLLAAGTTAVASIVVFALVLTGGPTPNTPERSNAAESPLGSLGDGALGINRPRTTVGIATTEGLHLEFADRDDPTRLSHVVDFGSVDPRRGSQFAVEEASAWIYLDDGRTVHVQAPSGLVIMPDRQDLQSGTFFDGVTIRLFDPLPDGGRPSLDRNAPALIARTPTLAFDLPRSTAAAKERLVVNGERVDFIGSDVLIVFDERDQTIRRLEVGSGERLAFRPREREQPTEAPAPQTDPVETASAAEPQAMESAPAEPATTRSTTTESAAPPVQVASAEQAPPDLAPDIEPAAPEPVVFYHALVRGNVTLTQRSRVIRGDQIDLWARTVGGAIPDDAFGPIESRTASARSNSTPSRAHAGVISSSMPGVVALSTMAMSQPSVGSAGSLEPIVAASDDEVELLWDGRLVLVPLESRPEPLSARNQLHVRVTDVGGDGLVELEDRESGATGRCATVDYAATIQEIELTGPGPRAVQVTLPDSGTVQGQRVTLGLSDSVARVVGPGQLTGAAREDEQPISRVSWTELARFEMTPPQGDDPMRVERVRFVGEVEAIDRDTTLTGGRVMAEFRPTEGDGFEIAEVDVRDGVEVTDGGGAEVRAKRMLGSFSPRQDEATAANEVALNDQLTFVGDVFVKRDTTELRSRTLDATLVPDGDSRRIGRIDARDGVRFERKGDRLLAVADRLVGEAEQERVELTGDLVLLSQGPSRIRATQAVLDGEARTMEVFGEGVYEQVDDSGAAEATVVWSDGMVIDDESGTLECTGDAFARWRAGLDGVDDISAERINVTYNASSDGGGEPLAFERQQSNRQITKVVAIGGDRLEGNGKPAIVQSLREVAVASGDRSLERLFRLEGPEIIADNQTGVLRVEHPGRLVLADLRPEDGTGAPSAGASMAPGDSGTARGSALFDWTESMVADRSAGTVLMIGDVRMTHARLADGLRTDLRSDRLLARFRETRIVDNELAAFELGPPSEDATVEIDLESVLGEGSVSLMSGSRELLADRLDYNADTGVVDATARQGNRVSLFDPGRVSPIRARAITWDLTTDRIDIQRPDPFVQPR